MEGPQGEEDYAKEYFNRWKKRWKRRRGERRGNSFLLSRSRGEGVGAG